MTSHTAPGAQPPPAIALQERVDLLEVRVAVLTEALRILTCGLEGTPTAGPRDRAGATAAARQAHELLLAAEPGPADE